MNRLRWLEVISEDNSIIWAILGLPGDDDDAVPLEVLLIKAESINGEELELLGD